MKIGFSTSVIQRGKTGIAQHVFALLRALDQLSNDYEYYLFVLEEDTTLFEGLSSRFRRIRIREKHRPPVRNILWHQFHLPRLAGRLGLDIVHVPSYRRLIWRAPCPRVGTIHDLAPFHVSGKYDAARMFYGKVFVKQLARRQDQIIAISEQTARDIERFFGIPKSSLNIIHNGLDHARFHPGPNSSAQNFAIARLKLAKPFLLYIARLEHPAKNHVRLIESFEQFKTRTASDWELVLGGSDWHGAEVIHERIRSSPFASDIRTLGFVSDDDLPALYRAASIFIYPSLFEGFGLPPIEAMACGCPVICSDKGSLGEIVGDAARIIDPLDTGSIAHSIHELAISETLRQQMRSTGFERSRQFDWKQTAERTIAVYEKATGARAQAFARNHPASLTILPS